MYRGMASASGTLIVQVIAPAHNVAVLRSGTPRARADTPRYLRHASVLGKLVAVL